MRMDGGPRRPQHLDSRAPKAAASAVSEDAMAVVHARFLEGAASKVASVRPETATSGSASIVKALQKFGERDGAYRRRD